MKKNNNTGTKWEIKSKKGKAALKIDDITNTLLANRGLKTKKEIQQFLHPVKPSDLTLKDVGIAVNEFRKAIKRIKRAVKNKEKIVIYGDYDADGICATAILWECLYSLTKAVTPYLPERFSEGYGLNKASVTKLKSEYPDLSLIITVDNGIVAHKAIEKANELGIDVVVTDHHQKEKKTPKAYGIVHTTKLSGAGISWILSREIRKKLKGKRLRVKDTGALELAAIGTIADQVPLLGPNRSIVKQGLSALNKTKRPGLKALFNEARISKEKGEIVGTYEVNFMVAPRLNAMGRMAHAIDSLRLLCTKSKRKAESLADKLGKTNYERQKVVDEVFGHAQNTASKDDLSGIIVLSHESYHEGVIGLAASKLVEEYYQPAIVISQGKTVSKASARSISGFNIIKAIRSVEQLILGGGGHPMAAGFSIKTSKIQTFSEKINKIAKPLLNNVVLKKTLNIDLELPFRLIDWELLNQLKDFEPAGVGNPRPTFFAESVKLLNFRTVGRDANHLKMTFQKDDKVFDGIAFNLGFRYPELFGKDSVRIAYSLEENIWNGKRSIQLRIKDIRV